MTPEEKAKELVNKMYMLDDPNGNYPMCFDIAKECALVAVDEILSAIPNEYLSYWKGESQMILNEDIDYWNEVKHEIEKL